MSFISEFTQRSALTFCIAGLVACSSGSQTYLERGNRAFDAGKYDDAALQYQKAIQKNPKLGELHLRLGAVELKREHLIPAYREFQRAAQLMPGNMEAISQSGQLALTLYRLDPKHPQSLYDQAEKSAAELLLKNAGGFEGNFLKGALALAEGKGADAAQAFRRSLLVKSHDAAAKLGLAQALIKDHQAAAGLKLAQELIQQDKSFVASYDFLYQQYRMDGKIDDAENILKQKVRNNPKDAVGILELARHYATVQKRSEMDATVQKLVSQPGEFPDGYLLAGDFYLTLNNNDEALRQFEKGLNASPKEKTLYRKRMVRVLAGQRSWPSALAQLAAVLKDNPQDQEAKTARAVVWLDEGKRENLDPAIAELRSELAKRPQDAGLHFQLGTGLLRKGDQEGARREWLAAAREDATNLPARFSMVQLNLSQGRAQEALRVANEIQALVPNDAQAALLHATCLSAAGEYREARTELTRLAAQFPKAPNVRFRLGVLAIFEQKYKEAEQTFNQLSKDGQSDPQITAGLAEAYAGQNEQAKALQLLQSEVNRNPQSPALRSLLARFATASGKNDLALAQYQQLAAATPGSVDAQLAVAAAYRAKGDLNAALETAKKAAAMDPKSGNALLRLAQALVMTGQWNEAKTRYRQLLQMQPSNPNALNDLAYLMAESGDNLDEALQLAQRGQQSTQNSDLQTSLADTLGWIYLKKNMNDSALQMFQKLVRDNPGDATYRYHLGATLLQKGEKQKARTELETALAAQPPSPDGPKIRQLLSQL